MKTPKPIWVAICKETGVVSETGATRKECLEWIEQRYFGGYGRWQEYFDIVKYIPAKARAK